MRKCEHCGAFLDPQEVCDCRRIPDDKAIACVTPPVIAENISSVATYVTAITDKLATLPRDKDGCASAKAMRADLRRKFEEMEEQRKTVKKAVLEPYNAAERKYKEQISEPIQAMDRKLKEWIDAYQNEVKQECQAELEDYFQELCGALHIDFLTFADTGVKVDMATANLQDPRKARNAIHDFLIRVEDDLRAIAAMEDGTAILAEYRVCKNLSAAISAVEQRKVRQREAEQTIEKHKVNPDNAPAVPPIAPPTKIDADQRVKCVFTVKATKGQVRKLKEFMNQEGISYE